MAAGAWPLEPVLPAVGTTIVCDGGLRQNRPVPHLARLQQTPISLIGVLSVYKMADSRILFPGL